MKEEEDEKTDSDLEAYMMEDKGNNTHNVRKKAKSKARRKEKL